MENPYQSPGAPLGSSNSTDPFQRRPGLVRHVRVVAILMFVQAAFDFFEITRSIFQGFLQWQMAAIMSDFLPRMVEASAPVNGPNAPQVVIMGTAVAKASLMVGFASQLVFSVAKLIYYAVGWSYLRRATVRRWLENTGA